MRISENPRLSLAALLLATAFTPFSARADLTFLNTWGSLGTANGQFQNPAGIALAPDGTVYVTDPGNARVQIFSSTGTFLSTFGSSGSGNGQFSDEGGIALAPNGNVYVADFFNSRAQIFSPTGTFIAAFGPIANPIGIGVNASGAVYVGDINNHINVFNAAGVLQNSFGSTGSGNGQLNGGSGLSIAASGNIYIADQGNNRVDVFTPGGNFQASFGTLGSGNGQLSDPTGVAVSASGFAYVVDRGNSRVEVFSPANAFQSTFGSLGTLNGQFRFDNSSYIAAAPTGMVYVADQKNNRIQRLFDPNSWTSGANTFTDPTTGPTSLSLGAGQILGQSFTLTSAMGLTLSGTLSVNSNGTFTQAGGSLSGANLSLAGRFNYQGGSFNFSNLTLNFGGLFQANQGGTLALSSGAVLFSTMSLDGGTNLTAGGAFIVNSPGLLNVNNATIVTPSFTINAGGIVQLNNPASSFIQGSLFDSGLLTGGGFINGSVILQSGGQLSVSLGQTLTVTNSSTSVGLVTLAGGTIHFTAPFNNGNGISPNLGTIQGFGTFRFDGGLNNLAFGTLSLAGSASVFGTITNNANATINLQGTQPNVFFNNIANNGSILIDKNASATFFGPISGNAPSASISLLQGASASLATTHAAVATSTLSLAGATNNWSSTLDLNNNALIIESSAASKSTTIATLRNQVLFAKSNPAGITSTGLPANMALATLDNAITGFTTFFGQPVDANSLLVAPELVGDANADGHVDLTDLSTILNNFGSTTPAWTSGNFDNAATIDLTDLSFVLNNFGLSNPSASDSSQLPVTNDQFPASAPEPASVLSLAPILLLTAKRRKYRKSIR